MRYLCNLLIVCHVSEMSSTHPLACCDVFQAFQHSNICVLTYSSYNDNNEPLFLHSLYLTTMQSIIKSFKRTLETDITDENYVTIDEESTPREFNALTKPETFPRWFIRTVYRLLVDLAAEFVFSLKY